MSKHTTMRNNKRKPCAAKTRKHRKQSGGVMPAFNKPSNFINDIKFGLANFGVPYKRDPTLGDIKLQEQTDIRTLRELHKKLAGNEKLEMQKILAESLYDGKYDTHKIMIGESIKLGKFKFEEDDLLPEYAKSIEYKAFVDEICFPKPNRKNTSSLSLKQPKRSQSDPAASNAWELVQSPRKASEASTPAANPRPKRSIIKSKTNPKTPAQNLEPATEFSFPKISKKMERMERMQWGKQLPASGEMALSALNLDTLIKYLFSLDISEPEMNNILDRIDSIYNVIYSDPRGYKTKHWYNLLSNGKEVIIIAQDAEDKKFNIKTLTQVILTAESSFFGSDNLRVYNQIDEGHSGPLKPYKCSLKTTDIEAKTKQRDIAKFTYNPETDTNIKKSTKAPMTYTYEPVTEKDIIEYKIRQKNKLNAGENKTKIFGTPPKANTIKHVAFNKGTLNCDTYITADECNNDPSCIYTVTETEKPGINKKGQPFTEKIQTTNCWPKPGKLEVREYKPEGDIGPRSVRYGLNP